MVTFAGDAPPYALTDGASNVSMVDIDSTLNVTVTGNTQPMTSGTFVDTSGCSGTIVTSPQYELGAA